MDPAKLSQLENFVELLKDNPDTIHLPELEFFRDYLESLGARIPERVAEVPQEEDPERMAEEADPMPPAPALHVTDLSEEQEAKLGDLKAKVQEAIEDGDRSNALEFLNQAVSIGGVTAMLMTKRADLLLKLKRPLAAIKDCDTALSLNPDSGKAFRIRGLAHRYLLNWERAHADLSAAQRIDYDESVEPIHRLVDEKFKNMVHKPQKKQEQAPRMPEMPAGMGGMFGNLFNDPEIASAMTNPRVMQAMQEMMTNPAALIQYQSDPEVGPVLMKLMSKFGGSM
jgi:suppressor of tumorigenicity protein 13